MRRRYRGLSLNTNQSTHWVYEYGQLCTSLWRQRAQPYRLGHDLRLLRVPVDSHYRWLVFELKFPL